MSKFSGFRIDEGVKELPKIDNKDEKIISILAEDSRTSISVISKQIRLSKEGVFYRIKKLREKAIQKFTPIFDLRSFGYNLFHVFFVIDESKTEMRERFIEFLIKHPNTKEIMEYSDRWDFEWVLAVKTIQEFDDVLGEATREFSDIIIEKNKFETIFGYKSIQLPVHSQKRTPIFKSKVMRKAEIDEKDIKVINELREDCRKSTYEIGEKIKASPDTVSYRIKKLNNNGIIREYSIVPNMSNLGYHWHTVCMTVKTFTMHHEMKFKEYLSMKPEIIRAVKVLGDWDIMLHIVTKEAGDYHRTVKELYRNFSDIIIHYQTWSAYKEHFLTSIPSACLKQNS